MSERDWIRGDRPQPRRRAPPVRPKAGPCEPTSAALGWLADRGISGSRRPPQPHRLGAYVHPGAQCRGRLHRLSLFPRRRTREHQIPGAQRQGVDVGEGRREDPLRARHRRSEDCDHRRRRVRQAGARGGGLPQRGLRARRRTRHGQGGRAGRRRSQVRVSGQLRRVSRQTREDHSRRR